MSRGNVTRAVHTYLDGEIAAREMLAHDVLNYRAFARHLIETQGWDVTEEAVVSALRRYPREPTSSPFSGARDLLKGSHIGTRANIWSLEFASKARVRDSLPRLFELVDPERNELLRIVEGDRAVKVVVSDEKVDAVLDTLSGCNLIHKIGNLVEYSISTPEEVRMTHGVLALLLATLAVNEINIRESVSGAGELLILVHDDESLKTYQVLKGLCSPPELSEDDEESPLRES